MFKVGFVLVAIVWLDCVFLCPTQQSKECTTVEEGSWSFPIADRSAESPVNVTIKSNTTYTCSVNDDEVELRSILRMFCNAPQVVQNKYELRTVIYNTFLYNNNTHVIIEFREKRDETLWTTLKQFTFHVNKNCGKFCWSLKNATTKRSDLPYEDDIQDCKDWDADKLEQDLYNENPRSHEDSQLIWIKEQPCVVTKCISTAGEAQRQGENLYGDGSEVVIAQFYSNHPAIMNEQCNNYATITRYCKDDFSNQSNNIVLNVGVGLIIPLLLLCILLVILRFHRRKSRTNSVTNQPPNSMELPIEEPSVISIVSNQRGQGQSSELICYVGQIQSSSHKYELAEPSVFSSYEIVLPTESLGNQCRQPDLPSWYEAAEPNMSNPSQAATQNTPDTDSSRTSKAHYSAAQALGIVTEQNNAYSALAIANLSEHSDYSALGPR